MKKILLLIVCLFLTSGVAFADWDRDDPYKMHFPQLPDPNGWDVYGERPIVLADDWLCTQTGPVTDIHFWGSWSRDAESPIQNIRIDIYKDLREGVPYSQPGEWLWGRDFGPNDFRERPYDQGIQGWINPETGEFSPENHSLTHQINITRIQEPFLQEKGNIYWLAITVFDENPDTFWGWKTSLDHFEDYAVWGVPGEWQEFRDPTGEPFQTDLAFVITTPIPGAIWLLASGLVGLLGIRRKFRKE